MHTRNKSLKFIEKFFKKQIQKIACLRYNALNYQLPLEDLDGILSFPGNDSGSLEVIISIAPHKRNLSVD